MKNKSENKKYFALQYAIYQCITFITKIILKIFCILFAQTIA